MNETPAPTPLPAEPANLQSEFELLRKQFLLVLVILIVLSAAVNAYLLRQTAITRKELVAIKPTVTQLVADYERVTVPLINDFLKKLDEYAKTHPDFAPIVAKYNIKATPAPTAAAPAGLISAPPPTALPPARTPSPTPQKQ